MYIWKFLRRYYFQLLTVILFLVPLLFLLQENSSKAVVMIFSILFWFVCTIRTRSPVLSSILYILITLPFNLTYQLSSSVLFFNTDPYVSGMYTNYLIPTLSILDMGLALLFMSYIYEYGFKHTRIVLKKYSTVLLVFLIFLVAQNILKISLTAVVESFRLFFFSLIIIFLIDYSKTKKHSSIRMYMLWISTISVLIQGVLGILQFKNGNSLGLSLLGESQVVNGMQGSSFVTLNNEVFLRAYGSFPHPNILGGYLVMNVLLGVYLYSKSKKNYRVLSIILIILSAIFVIFTFSRISICLVLVILLVGVLWKLIKGRLFSFTPFLFVERFTNLISGNDTSWRDRANLIKSSLNVIRNNLWFGTGLGNFTKAMETDIPRTTNWVLLIQPVHNVFLLMLAELGVLGTFSYFVLMGTILRRNISNMNIFKWLVVLTLVVIGCFDHYLFSLPQGLIIGGILYLFLVL